MDYLLIPSVFLLNLSLTAINLELSPDKRNCLRQNFMHKRNSVIVYNKEKLSRS